MPTALSAPEFVACFVALCCSPFWLLSENMSKNDSALWTVIVHVHHSTFVIYLSCRNSLKYALPSLFPGICKAPHLDFGSERKYARVMCPEVLFCLQVLFWNVSKTATRVANFCEFDVFCSDMRWYLCTYTYYTNITTWISRCWFAAAFILMVHFVFVVASVAKFFISYRIRFHLAGQGRLFDITQARTHHSSGIMRNHRLYITVCKGKDWERIF